jgi:hypothetical protein
MVAVLVVVQGLIIHITVVAAMDDFVKSNYLFTYYVCFMNEPQQERPAGKFRTPLQHVLYDELYAFVPQQERRPGKFRTPIGVVRFLTSVLFRISM